MTNEIELKPFPFCGGKADFNNDGGAGNRSSADLAVVVAVSIRVDKAKAAEFWNRRHNPASGLFDRIRALSQSRVEYWKMVPLESFDEGHMDMLVGQFQEIANDIAAAAAVRDKAGEGVANSLPVYSIPQID